MSGLAKDTARRLGIRATSCATLCKRQQIHGSNEARVAAALIEEEQASALPVTQATEFVRQRSRESSAAWGSAWSANLGVYVWRVVAGDQARTAGDTDRYLLLPRAAALSEDPAGSNWRSYWDAPHAYRLWPSTLRAQAPDGRLISHNLQIKLGAPDLARERVDAPVVLWLPSGWWVTLQNERNMRRGILRVGAEVGREARHRDPPLSCGVAG